MNAGLLHPRPRRIWAVSDNAELDRLLDELANRPAAVMANGRVLKHDVTTTVVVAGRGGQRWVVKRYNTKNGWHAVRRLLRSSRAANCRAAAALLSNAAIDTPRPLAVVEERYPAGLRGRAYLVCEFIDGPTLDRLLRQDGDARPRLVEQAADIVLRLRDSGIVHGDLKATNFIVYGERMYLVDLDATRPASGARLVAGLRRDLERFLRNWQDQPELLQQFEKRLGSLDA